MMEVEDDPNSNNNNNNNNKPITISQYDYATLYEKWHLEQERLIAQQHKRKADDNNEDKEEDGGFCSFYTKALAVRVGKMGTLQCAIRNNQSIKTTTSSSSSTSSSSGFLQALVERMDLKERSSSSLVLPKYVTESHQSHHHHHHHHQTTTTTTTKTTTTASAMDDFFDEYPECMRKDWETIGYDDSSTSSSSRISDDDSHDVEEEEDGEGETRRNSKKRPVSIKTTIPAKLPEPPSLPFTMDHHEQQQQSSCILYSQASSSSDHNTQKTTMTMTSSLHHQSFQAPAPPQGPQSSFGYNTTHCQDHRQQQQQQHHHHHQQQQANNNNNNNNNNGLGWDDFHPQSNNDANNNRRFLAPPNLDPAAALAYAQQQQQQHKNFNPFQTAKEYADVIGYQQQQHNNNHQNHNHNYDGSGRGPSSSLYNNQYRKQNQDDEQHQRQHQREEDEEEGNDVVVVVPNIRESLKRKFQPPSKRANNNNNKSNNSNAAAAAAAQMKKPQGMTTISSSAGINGNGGGNNSSGAGIANNQNVGGGGGGGGGDNNNNEDDLPEALKKFGKDLVEKIQSEIMDNGEAITFDDIAGLEDAKKTIDEIVCWPMKRPELFTGLRKTPNGLLLFGPPGTGKTLIGKAIAHASGATFFSISSSALTSKWMGEGEKLVRTLFGVAAFHEPSCIFLDEVDSLLTQRKSDDSESSRRIKTEFLVQLDGSSTSKQGRVLVIGATNVPGELDEAARRRFVKRLYIPLPKEGDRACLLRVLLAKNDNKLTDIEIETLAHDTKGFSGADLKALCADAAMGPIRQLGPKAMEVHVDDLPPITFKHFRQALRGMKPSVSPDDIAQYELFDKTYGSKRASEMQEDDGD